VLNGAGGGGCDEIDDGAVGAASAEMDVCGDRGRDPGQAVAEIRSRIASRSLQAVEAGRMSWVSYRPVVFVAVRWYLGQHRSAVARSLLSHYEGEGGDHAVTRFALLKSGLLRIW
jgi:hypothetical protein